MPCAYNAANWPLGGGYMSFFALYFCVGALYKPYCVYLQLNLLVQNQHCAILFSLFALSVGILQQCKAVAAGD